jgi:hypothetical protein
VPKGCMRAGARTGGHERKACKSTVMRPFVVQQLLRRLLTQAGQYEPIEVGRRAMPLASLTWGHMAIWGGMNDALRAASMKTRREHPYLFTRRCAHSAWRLRVRRRRHTVAIYLTAANCNRRQIYR